MTKTDALGNELIVGGKYAYAARDGSIVNVIAGTLQNIGAKRAVLRVEDNRTFINGTLSEYKWERSPTVNVQGCMLFPVA